MCSIKFIAQQTGLTEEELTSNNRKANICVNRGLCYDCLYKKKHLSFQKIANLFNRKSHATVINGIKVVTSNPGDKQIKKAKQNHACYFVKEKMEKEEKVEKQETSVEEILYQEMTTTSVLSPRFEEIIRRRNIFDRKYSPQRT